MRMFTLVLPGLQAGRDRYEYACEQCFAQVLDDNPSVKRVERHAPRDDEHCPHCGEPDE